MENSYINTFLSIVISVGGGGGISPSYGTGTLFKKY